MKYISILFAIVFLYSCSTKKGISKKFETRIKQDYINYNYYQCLDSLGKHDEPDSAGPINLRVQIDSAQIGNKNTFINKIFEISIDKESDMIVFGDTLGIKLFHTYANVYGNIKHYVKYDFFIKDNECWKRRIEFGFSEVHMYREIDYVGHSGSYSTGSPHTEAYIKIVWRLNRIKNGG